MPGAIIAFDQVRGMSTSYGTPGVARNDLWESDEVICRCTTSGNTSYAWEFTSIPAGSAAALANADLSSANFTPDLPGSYSVQLTTNGGGPGNVQILIAAVRYNSSGVLVNRGWRIPAVGELAGQDNFSGQLRGWSEAFEYIFADILAFLESAGGLSVQDAGTIVGPNAVQTYAFTLPVGTTTVEFYCQARIAAPGGADVAGDSYATSGKLTFTNVAGVATLLPADSSFPYEAYTASMRGTDFSFSVTGAECVVTCTTNSTINAATTVDFQISGKGYSL